MLEATTRTIPDPSRRVPLIVGAWLTLGITLALGGALSRIPQLGPAFVFASAIGWSIAYAQRGAVRDWADALPMRAIIAAHALRFPIGAVFLWEASQGQIPQLFADRAGWGDIAVGLAAIPVALVGWKRARVVLAFAVVGLVDIMVALGTAMYLLFVVHDPLMIEGIARQPYPMLPLAIVPLVVVTHLLMIARADSSSASRPATR